MHPRTRTWIGSLALLVLIAAPTHAATALTAERMCSGLAKPVFVTSPPGDSRLFIVEQRGPDARGRIRIFKPGGAGLLARSFLVTAPLATGNEQGLLGLAFAPDYATSGRFYIHYNDASGMLHIERHRVSATDPDSADASFAENLLSIYHPFTNHNGGWMAFGPDGYLYDALGDGGNSGTPDPANRAQNADSLLGKILRLDVSGPTGYTSPPTNPFAGATPGRDEIYLRGVRNPFRDSFDRATGDLILGDVGQSALEEIDFLPAASGRGLGLNLGWPCWEGDQPYDAARPTPCVTCGNTACFTFPAWEYDHSLSRCAVTGGYVYRGSAIPDLVGTYFFADYCAARIYTGQFVGGALTNVQDRTVELTPVEAGVTVNSISSFGEDRDGELYMCDLGGELFKIVPLAAVNTGPPPAARVPRLSIAGAMPFKSTLRLALDLPVAARASIVVFDLAGRQVRALLEQDLPAGPNALAWDGLDDRGVPARPGVYLVRALVPGGETSVRAVRIR
jgi:glucose/arabinose dehydrogenase